VLQTLAGRLPRAGATIAAEDDRRRAVRPARGGAEV